MEYKEVFRQMPNNYLLVDIDSPRFTMLDISDKHLMALGFKRDELVGHGLFDVFKDNEKNEFNNSADLFKSFMYVIIHKESHHMDMMRYDIPNARGKFEIRYWKVSNYPFFIEGKLTMIINYAIDVSNVFSGLKLL